VRTRDNDRWFPSDTMGLYDRDYTQEKFRSQMHYSPQVRMGFPKTVVMRLLVINVAVYFIQILGGHGLLVRWFSVYPASWVEALQVWRLVTYQFLHGDILHIFFNMLCLFFLGRVLEQHWGGKKFLLFYLGCGAVGGLVYPLLYPLKIISPHPVFGVLPLIGASGAVLGVLAACAILFPNIVMLFFFFPLPIRVVAIILTLLAVAGIITGENAGGQAAHLGGMIAGSVYVVSRPWRDRVKRKFQSGRWERKVAARRDLQVEVDRILEKVHDSGIHSLTASEKRILKKATETERVRHRL
jgi:membrane associated rhomboid family serine protease